MKWTLDTALESRDRWKAAYEAKSAEVDTYRRQRDEAEGVLLRAGQGQTRIEDRLTAERDKARAQLERMATALRIFDDLLAEDGLSFETPHLVDFYAARRVLSEFEEPSR